MSPNRFSIMIQTPLSHQQDNANIVPAEPQPAPRTNRVRHCLRKPCSMIRNAFRRLQNVLLYHPERSCPTCRYQVGRAHHDDLGQAIPDVPPPAYMVVDPTPPEAPRWRQRQRATRDYDRGITTTAAGAGAGSPMPRTRSTTALARTTTTATATTHPNQNPNRNPSTNTSATPTPTLPITMIEAETAPLHTIRAAVAAEERQLQSLRRRRVALEHSLTNSRMRWNEELERSLASYQLRLRTLDSVYRTRLPLQPSATLARSEEMFFRERPPGKVSNAVQ